MVRIIEHLNERVENFSNVQLLDKLFERNVCCLSSIFSYEFDRALLAKSKYFYFLLIINFKYKYYKFYISCGYIEGRTLTC